MGKVCLGESGIGKGMGVRVCVCVVGWSGVEGKGLKRVCACVLRGKGMCRGIWREGVFGGGGEGVSVAWRERSGGGRDRVEQSGVWRVVSVCGEWQDQYLDAAVLR